MLALGLALAFAGACTVWLSTVPAVSALGLLLGGLGVSGLFPVGLSVALQAAPEAQLQASARVTLASGAAILLAPSALGLAADAVGVVGAWAIIPGLAIAAMTVVATMPSGRPLPDVLPDVLPDIVMDATLEVAS
jgi:MFS family permease